jgi:DNA-binding CsgD family transcriptional regulator
VSFALGITRGLSPQGPIPMDAVMRCVHQLGVVAISAGIAWYGGVLGRRVSAAALWGIDIAVVAVGILLVPALPRGLAGLGVALANLGDTLSLGIVWMLAMDYARHASVSAFAVVGAAWFARIFFRDVARTIAPTLVAASVAVDALAGAVVLALAGAMAILLTGIVPRGHKLLDDGTPAEGEVACCALTGGGVRGAAAAGASGAPGHVASVLRGGSAGDPFGARVELLREECGLTEREAQVCALIASGRNKTGVAERLSLSENTVRTHSKNAYAKLGIHTKEELVSLIERLEGRHGIGL